MKDVKKETKKRREKQKGEGGGEVQSEWKKKGGNGAETGEEGKRREEKKREGTFNDAVQGRTRTKRHKACRGAFQVVSHSSCKAIIDGGVYSAVLALGKMEGRIKRQANKQKKASN